jgi:hypothetical protein
MVSKEVCHLLARLSDVVEELARDSADEIAVERVRNIRHDVLALLDDRDGGDASKAVERKKWFRRVASTDEHDISPVLLAPLTVQELRSASA